MKVLSYADHKSILAAGSRADPVTPADDGDLPIAALYLYVGTGGTVVLRALESDEDVPLLNVPSGSYIFGRIRAVRATGTTASDIVAWS